MPSCVLAAEEEENGIWDYDDNLTEFKRDDKIATIAKNTKSNDTMNNLCSSESSPQNIGIVDPGPPNILESRLGESSSEALNLAAEAFVVLTAGKIMSITHDLIVKIVNTSVSYCG